MSKKYKIEFDSLRKEDTMIEEELEDEALDLAYEGVRQGKPRLNGSSPYHENVSVLAVCGYALFALAL